jgi:hypothetical protein
MQEQWNWAVGKPDAETVLLSESQAWRPITVTSTSPLPLQIRPNLWVPSARTTFHALREAEGEVGNAARAQRTAAKALNKVQRRSEQLALALVFARAGDIAHAQKLADTLSQGSPLDTAIQYYSLPTIRAAMKLQENDLLGLSKTCGRRSELSSPVANPPQTLVSTWSTNTEGR